MSIRQHKVMIIMAVPGDRRRVHADHADILLMEIGGFERINLLKMGQILLMRLIGNAVQKVVIVAANL